MSPFFAHSRPNRPEDEWEPLGEHLTKVADLARDFGERFAAGEWARLAGLWHDLGKYSEAFQNYLRASALADPHTADRLPKVDHSTAGAQHAVHRIDVLGHLLAYPIAGHHAGLLDAISEGASLQARLRKTLESWEGAPESIRGLPAPQLTGFLREALADRNEAPFRLSFFVRMLFSCLVDADFLATECFLAPEKSGARPRWPEDVLLQMERVLASHLDSFGEPLTRVDVERQRVLDACRRGAVGSAGFFSLTVPTGGGKTLSSLAFAVRHAVLHAGSGQRFDRVIYVAPFTTIIEQNARVFRDVFAPLARTGVGDVVLEHHSNFEASDEDVVSRLATENWDAPLVVTTAVQFYESLFGNRTSQCRKLHRIARSVVILDEAQAIPVDCLAPCLRALRELVDNYGVTVLLCTATQPALHRRPDFDIGLKGVRELIPDPPSLYQSLRRVTVSQLGQVTDANLAERLLAEQQVLCVVNTRGHARSLFELIGDHDGHFHLSALMCPAHRSAVLCRIRERLRSGGPCRVVSTQLIEAGVDIDFPCVLRSLAGIDAIAQAAGRCNREGRLEELGRVFIFASEHRSSERFVAETAGCARQVLSLHEDPLTLEAVESYFRLYYWDQKQRWDARGVLGELHLANDRELPFLFNFSTIADRFRMIEDSGRPVVVPWGPEGRTLCEQLTGPGGVADWKTLRVLQRFTVQIPSRTWEEHRNRSFTIVQDRFAVLVANPDLYSESLGLSLGGNSNGAYFA